MKKHKVLLFFLSSLLIFLIIFVAALLIGRYQISLSDFFKAIFTNDESVEIERNIIVNLRLPRTIVAGVTGVALSVSGLLYQETFQNKLVSPDLLGVSNGAGVGAALAIVLGLSTAFVNIFAFAIAVGTVLLTCLVAKLFRNASSMTLLLSGIIISGLMGSVLALIKYFAEADTQLAVITYWLMGTFSRVDMMSVYVLAPIVAILIAILLILRWRINIVALGKEEAESKGLNYKFYRYLIIGIATLLTASTVAFCGTISWVGLVIPHIVRIISGRDTRKSIPLCITFGAVFMVVVDIISRSFTDQEIPLSAITGIFGTVIFIIVLVRYWRSYHEHQG
ncbi:MAG: iron ABC transporter permease [Bacilli bacterium]|nr:iron ABC transporter permease [Bacilli bacterium]